MSYDFKKIKDLDFVEEVPEGANVLIEIEGSTKRLPSTAIKASVAPPDMSQNDPTAPDYVKNRTHWSETSTELRTLTLDATSEDHGSVNDIDVARAIFEDPSCAVLTLLGTEYNIGDYPYEDNHYERRYIIVKGTYDDKYFSVSLKDGVPTSRIAYNNFYCGGAEVRVMVTTENVHKLDLKYLPIEELKEALGIGGK